MEMGERMGVGLCLRAIWGAALGNTWAILRKEANPLLSTHPTTRSDE